MATAQELVEAIRQASAISCHEDDEAEPYKNKYCAADLLRKILGERAICEQGQAGAGADSGHAQAQLAVLTHPTVPDAGKAAPVETATSSTSSGPGNRSSSSRKDAAAPPAPAAASLTGGDFAAAAARIRCGLILLETDLLADGEASIRAGLPLLEQHPDSYLAWLLEAYNALGALYR